MSTDGNDPAYPDRNNTGLTKREYFAAMALKGILSDPEEVEMESDEGEEGEEEYGETPRKRGNGEMERMEGESCIECSCRLAVEHADMLIKELNK